MRQVLHIASYQMNTTRALAITATVFLLPLTGLLAGLLAFIFWEEFPDDLRALVFVPIVLFALSSVCLVGCARTRDGFTGIVLVLGALGILGFLAYLTLIAAAAAYQY